MVAPSAPSSSPPTTRGLILEVALRRFADHGFFGTSLNDIADEVGIRRQSLLHHFASKEALYREVLVQSFSDWVALLDEAVEDSSGGLPEVERVLMAGFRFFEEHPGFVRLMRREALEGGPIMLEELARRLRPLFGRAVAFFEREMDEGRVRRFDARHLLLSAYGAILSYFSDAALIGALLGEDALDPRLLDERRRHLIQLFRHALKP
ncbi:MAG: TetR family transcriptional regulator [Acidimicrobiia bacterium]